MKLKLFNGLVSSIIVSSLCLLLETCGPTTIEQNKPDDNKENEALVRANKYLVKKDADNIKAYIKRHKWNMKETGSGLWYEIFEHGHGKQVSSDLQVTLKYNVELLDGKSCYNSDSTGYKIFIVGSYKVESGLNEGILFMHEGDKARFILPPHLAYGLVGDDNRIPARSIIVYVVELLKVENLKRH